MFCQKCGQKIDNNAGYCINCGMQQYSGYTEIKNDSPNAGFAVLGFFFPIVGLILYLVFMDEKPKRAKSAGKGALISVILKAIAGIIFAVVYFTGIAALLGYTTDLVNNTNSDFSSFSWEENGELYEDEVAVTFGSFNISEDSYYYETSLDVIVKNIDSKRRNFSITIEAVDENGARLDTDVVYARQLNPQQEIYLKAFEYVEDDLLEQFKSAQFKVLEVKKY